MKYCQEFAQIDRPFDTVFDLFSDPERLSDWAIEYCQSVTAVEGGFVAETVEGERCFNVRSDRTTGVADVCSGPNHDELTDILYIRVVPASAESTFVHLLYPPTAPVPPEVLELMKTGLTKEVAHTKAMLEGAKA